MDYPSSLLSICIPTYNNCESLLRLINSINTQLQSYRHCYEICISVNGCSSTEQAFFSELNLPCTRFFFLPTNRGYGANLYNCLSKSANKYILMLGDDDFPTHGSLTSLLQSLTEVSPTGLSFVPLSDQPNISSSSIGHLFCWIFMRSASLMGIVLHRSNLSYVKQLDFDLQLYPQVTLALRTYLKSGYSCLSIPHPIIAGSGLPLKFRFHDKMNRPLDYGLIERYDILRSHVSQLTNKSSIFLYSAFILSTWFSSVFLELFRDKPLLAIRFLLSLFQRPFFALISIFSLTLSPFRLS